MINIERTSTLNAINNIGSSMAKIGINPFKTNTEKLIKKAIKSTNYQSSFPENLKESIVEMVCALNKEAKPNTFGALAIKKLFQRTLISRLKVEQALKKNPDILKNKIEEPIFIIGMPRTGTTILHALMNRDLSHRSPLAWECLLPYPVPRSETYTNNPAINTIAKEFDQLFKLVPDFKQKHYIEPDSPQECIGINALDFNSFQIVAQLYVPSYLDWFLNKFEFDADQGSWGTVDNIYCFGRYRLEENDYLKIQFTSPECCYWGIQTWNYLMQSMDYKNYKVGINKGNAIADDDGSYTIYLSHRKMEVDNWLCTAGYKEAIIFCRWLLAEKLPDSKAILFFETLSFNTNRLESEKRSFSSNLSINI